MSLNGLVVALAQGAPQIDGHINGPKLHSFVFVVDYRPCCKSPLQLFCTTSATPPLKMASLIVCPLLHLFLPDAPLKMYCLSLYILYFTFFYRKMTFHNSWKHSIKLGSPSLQGVR
jgi:hypothetical protein